MRRSNLRRLAALAAASAVIGTAIPQGTAFAAAPKPLALAQTGQGGGAAWWDPFGWFGTGGHRPNPKASQFAWHAPVDRSAASVKYDPTHTA